MLTQKQIAVVARVKKQFHAQVSDVAELAGLFFDAADAERRMPLGIYLGVRTGWPEARHDSVEAYGWAEEDLPPRPATAQAVERYDLALQLTLLLSRDDARLVWDCARSAARRQRGPAWRKIGRNWHMSGQTCKRHFERAILGLWCTSTSSLRVPRIRV